MHKFKTKLLAIISAITIAATTVTCPTSALDSPNYIYEGEIPEIKIDKDPDNINYETVIDASDYVPKSGKKRGYLVNFNDVLSTGITDVGSNINFEADYGLNGVIYDDKLYIKTYNHTGKRLYTYSTLTYLYTNAQYQIALPCNYVILDITNRPKGLYRLDTQFSNKKQTKVKTVSIYIYITQDGKIFMCDLMYATKDTMKIYIQHRQSFNNITKSVSPTQQMGVYMIQYPVRQGLKRRCDTQKFAEVAKTLYDENDSYEYRFYKIYQWVTKEIAYDYYKRDNIVGTRAYNANDYTGTYSTWDTKAGVCLDYANILAIMCRTAGIPTITVGTESMNHVWNAMYINNKWWEIDASVAAREGVWTEDMYKRTPRHSNPYKFVSSMLPHLTADFPADGAVNKYLLT